MFLDGRLLVGGIEIETWCKQSIRRDYDLPIDLASKLIEAVDECKTAGSDLIIELGNKKRNAYQCTPADGQELSLILSVGQRKA